MNLSGKVLVITGSNCALGHAVAATLSRYGARLALLDHGQTPSAAPPAGALHYGGIDLTQADFSRWVTPVEAAEVIAFLVSDEARAVTGALIPVVGRV